MHTGLFLTLPVPHLFTHDSSYVVANRPAVSFHADESYSCTLPILGSAFTLNLLPGSPMPVSCIVLGFCTVIFMLINVWPCDLALVTVLQKLLPWTISHVPSMLIANLLYSTSFWLDALVWVIHTWSVPSVHFLMRNSTHVSLHTWHLHSGINCISILHKLNDSGLSMYLNSYLRPALFSTAVCINL